VRLPWGGKIKVCPVECVGAGIWCYGIFDLIVPEAVARLLDSGEVCADVGANIGLVSLLMAKKTGSKGAVLAFEPHPQNFSILGENKLMNILHAESLHLFKVALGSERGSGALLTPCGFSTNTGTAKLAAPQDNKNAEKIPVRVETLDDAAAAFKEVHLCKIDVEGGELDVLMGAKRLIDRKGIRDILYEDVGRNNKPLHVFLTKHGYTLFSLHTDFLKPRIENWEKQKGFNLGIEGENFLATLNPERVKKRFSSLGWKALQRI